jgi:hypothetical protein
VNFSKDLAQVLADIARDRAEAALQGIESDFLDGFGSHPLQQRRFDHGFVSSESNRLGSLQ